MFTYRVQIKSCGLRSGSNSNYLNLMRALIKTRELTWILSSTSWITDPSVQLSPSVVSNSLRPHESQHARPPCPSPIPRVHPNSCASSRWCHPAISFSVVPFSSCHQSLTKRTFVGKVMSLLLSILSRLVITFLPRSKRLLILWLQSPSAVILEPPKIKSDTVSTVSPSISHEVMGPDAYRGIWNSPDENDYTKYTIHWTTFIQKQLNIKLLARSDFSITWSISTELHKSSKYWHILSPSDNHQLKYKYATLAVMLNAAISSWKSQHVHSFLGRGHIPKSEEASWLTAFLICWFPRRTFTISAG